MMHVDLIKPEESLLLVIDLQDKFVPYLQHAGRILSATKILLDSARVHGMPVVVSEHNPKRIGRTVDPLKPALAESEGFAPIYHDKMIFSCLGDDEIRKTIEGFDKVKNILICGCETHICVMQSALMALELGYTVHVAADGVGSRMGLDYEMGLRRMDRAGVVVATAEMMAYELLRRADVPEFKAMLPTFKDWVARVNE